MKAKWASSISTELPSRPALALWYIGTTKVIRDDWLPDRAAVALQKAPLQNLAPGKGKQAAPGGFARPERLGGDPDVALPLPTEGPTSRHRRDELPATKLRLPTKVSHSNACGQLSHPLAIC